MYKISENSMNCFVNFLNKKLKTYQFHLPEEEIRYIINRWKYYIEDEDIFYKDETDYINVSLDTATRELLLEILAKEFVGEQYSWPVLGDDDEEYKKFFIENLCKNIIKREQEMKGVCNANREKESPA